MTSRIRLRKFRKAFFSYFFIYLIALPAAFYLLDKKMLLELLKEDVLNFALLMTGIAFIISLLLATWMRKDPELRRW